MVSRNSTPGGFAYIWQSKWVGIIAIKTERTEIQFLSDVFVAAASLDLKVPNAITWRTFATLPHVGLRVYGKVRASPHIQLFFKKRELSLFLLVNGGFFLFEDASSSEVFVLRWTETSGLIRRSHTLSPLFIVFVFVCVCFLYGLYPYLLLIHPFSGFCGGLKRFLKRI